MKIRVIDNFTASAAALLASRASKAENIVAERVAATTEPFVPFLNGMLVKNTRVVGNTIIYPGPYARYLYYGKVMVYPEGTTGVNKDPNNPHHFGEKKVVTDKDLKYTGRDYAGPHKEAGPFWIERSKAVNLEKWIKLSEEVMNGGK